MTLQKAAFATLSSGLRQAVSELRGRETETEGERQRERQRERETERGAGHSV